MIAVEPDRIAAHAEVTTHVADGKLVLAQQFRRSTIEAILSPWLVQVQELESAVWDCYALGIDNSAGDALDQIGALLRLARPAGLSDSAYRTALRAVVLTLKSSGSGPEILAVMRALVGSYAFTMTQAFPASLVIEPDAPLSIPAEVALSILSRGASGGVRLQVIDVPDADLFTFSSETEVSETGDMGFSDTSGTPGGALVGVVST